MTEDEAVPVVADTPRPVWRALGRDLALALSGGLLLVALVGIAEWFAVPAWLRSVVQVLQLPLGLAYVLFVPGWCLTAALFARVDDLDDIERVGLGLGLSVAWVSLLALILDRLPWGLRLWPILLGELASCAVFAAVALWRRIRQPAGEAHAPQLDWRPCVWWRRLPRFDRRIYIFCAVALLVATLAAAWIFLVPSPDEFMTEFYILGKGGQAEDYPREAVPGEVLTVTMGIHNLERGTMTYRAEVWAVDPWEDLAELVAGPDMFTLVRDQTVEAAVEWAMPWVGQDQMVEFRLYSDEQGPEPTEPYRLLRLWLNVNERVGERANG